MIICVAQNKSARRAPSEKEKEMGIELYDNYVKAQNAVVRAKEWVDLPNGKNYRSDAMAISLAHCKAPMLMRAGQQSCGGQNYWESPKDLNDAILKIIIMEQKTIIAKAILLLEETEMAQLDKTQEFIAELQDKVEKAKKERTSCAQGSATRNTAESAEYSNQQAKHETVKPNICLGTGHGSCKGDTICDPDNVCFRPA